MMMVLLVGTGKSQKGDQLSEGKREEVHIEVPIWFQALLPHQIRALSDAVPPVMQIRELLSFSTPAHLPSYLIFCNDATTFESFLSLNLSI